MNASEFSAWLDSAPPRRPLIMGVLNLTPDSFSDGGRFDSTERALAHARSLVADGADLIDVGGESTRPGSLPVPSDEQIRRVVPVIRAIIAESSRVVLSIDTTRADVACAAVDAGASVVNDISAGRDDAAMLPFVASRQTPIILMHMQGTPQTMQLDPKYDDVVAEVIQFFEERHQTAVQAGIAPNRILLDPGLGFGKTDEHNLTLLRQTARLAATGLPLVIGASRKGFIGRITGEADAANRIFGTAAAVAWSVANGAGIVRVHDVSAMRKIVLMTSAIAAGLSQSQNKGF